MRLDLITSLRAPALPRARDGRSAYAVAILAPLAALALDVAAPALLERAAFFLLLGAIVVAAWYGGRLPSLVALVGASSAAVVVLAQPIATQPPSLSADAIRLGAFVAGGGVVAWLTAGLRDAREAARRESLEAQASRSELLAVLESVANPIALVDSGRRVLFANSAAVASSVASGGSGAAGVGGAVEEFLPQPLLDAAGAPVPPAEHPLDMALAGHAVRAAPFKMRLPDGAERHVVGEATPIEGGAGGMAAAVVLSWRDATPEYEADVAREAFMGVLAHELRTPITTVYGGAQLLASRGDRLDALTRREIARDVYHEATRLNRIADNLLVLSRVERGELRIASEPVLVEPVVRAAVESEAARWPAAQFSVETDGRARIPVAGEAGYIEQVVRNLVSNAAKYGGGEGVVRVIVERKNRSVVVSVVDEGPGFPPEDAERLFELFYRAPNTATAAPGSGIGLYVCRRLIEAMGGRIWAEGRPGEGATFGLSLAAMSAGEARGEEIAIAAS